MSMSTSMSYGYGFSLSSLTVEKFEAFIKNHADTIKNHGVGLELELIDEVEVSHEQRESNKDPLQILTLVDYEEMFDSITCESTGIDSTYAIIGNIITRETGVEFAAWLPDDEGEGAAIAFSPKMPWGLSEAERNIDSEDALKNLIAPYVLELGIELGEIGDIHRTYEG